MNSSFGSKQSRFAVALSILLCGCPRAEPAAQKDEASVATPPEVLACRKQLDKAKAEVSLCGAICNYPAYCCSIEKCGTREIEAWQKQEASCAEWGVTYPTILWPKPNTGMVVTDAPGCYPEPAAETPKADEQQRVRRFCAANVAVWLNKWPLLRRSQTSLMLAPEMQEAREAWISSGQGS